MRQPNVSLAQYTYMRVGGIADWMRIIHSTAELVEEIQSARQNNLRYIVIGGGSNVLFTDKGFRGVVIINQANHVEVDPLHYTITSESGAPTNLVVGMANDAGLAGLAGFMGIPGSIGGAIYNNAHYANASIGDYVKSVTLLDGVGNQKRVSSTELQFGYDSSILQQTHDTVLSVEFELEIGDPKILKQTSEQSIMHRKTTQPLEYPSSGCMFKNLSTPIETGITSAGALIDQAGLKGMSIGGAVVSDKHANFIINRGGATAQDVIDLSNEVITRVNKKWGANLEREVFIINEYGERMGA